MEKIAIIGKARSGKSTVLELMKKIYTEEGKLVLHYDVSHALYPITETLFPGSVYGEHKDRSKLQLVGQTIRKYDPNFWISAMERAIYQDESFIKCVDVLIVTGVRQPNEYQYLKDNNFQIIKVDTFKENRQLRAEKEGDINYKETFQHETKKYIDNFKANFIISNNNSKEDLEYKVRLLLA